MHLFWQRGYHSVSTRDLTQAMGINVYSLYAEFENKQGLFDAAIRHYEHDMVPFYIGALEHPDASLDTIRQVLHAFPAFADTDDFVPGCLITNTAIELAPTPEASHDSMARYIDRLTAAYTNALTSNDTSPPIDQVTTLARFLTSTTVGLFVMLRAQIGQNVLQDTVDTALSYLDRPDRNQRSKPWEQ